MQKLVFSELKSSLAVQKLVEFALESSGRMSIQCFQTWMFLQLFCGCKSIHVGLAGFLWSSDEMYHRWTAEIARKETWQLFWNRCVLTDCVMLLSGWSSVYSQGLCDKLCSDRAESCSSKLVYKIVSHREGRADVVAEIESRVGVGVDIEIGYDIVLWIIVNDCDCQCRWEFV